MTQEQRKSNRFKPITPVFASLGSNLAQVGKIIDISVGGLSFEFISDEKAMATAAHVDIFSLDQTHNLEALPCILVYQLSARLPGKTDDDADSYRTRKCGLKYTALKADQWRKLADFLENHTTGLESPQEEACE